MTNALDGVLERAARDIPPARLATIDSPREAAREFFGISYGRLAALDDAEIEGLASSVTVTISDGTAAGCPTLEVRDRGAGIPADRMRTSILDLAGSNKLDKPYLAGAYGQGGSTTFGFTARGSVIASSADGVTGCATYVRFSILDPRKNKNGRYEYLVDARGDVPSFDVDGRAVRTRNARAAFRLRASAVYGGALSTADGLLGLANAALFDPVLPNALARRTQAAARSRERSRSRARLGGLSRAGADIALHHALGHSAGKARPRRSGSHSLFVARCERHGRWAAAR